MGFYTRAIRLPLQLLAAGALAALSAPLSSAPDDAALLKEAEWAWDDDEIEEAFAIWKQLADRGNLEAQFILASTAQTCHCVDDGIDLALTYYEKAGMQGRVEAWQWMGWIYNIHKRDKDQAAKYYKIAADKGDAKSQIELGDLYRDGLGGAPTLALMPKYYLLAAAQGDEAAYSRLGRLYTEGKQVKADPIRAYVAYAMAAAQYFPLAKERTAEAKKKLTAKQFIKANILADKCVKAKFLKCL